MLDTELTPGLSAAGIIRHIRYIQFTYQVSKQRPPGLYRSALTTMLQHANQTKKNSVALRLSDSHLSTKFSANFCGYRGVAWSARRIPYGR
jgi:hypothetical protein